MGRGNFYSNQLSFTKQCRLINQTWDLALLGFFNHLVHHRANVCLSMTIHSYFDMYLFQKPQVSIIHNIANLMPNQITSLLIFTIINQLDESISNNFVSETASCSHPRHLSEHYWIKTNPGGELKHDDCVDSNDKLETTQRDACW